MKIDKAEARQTGIQLLKYAVIGASNTLITLVAFYLLNTKLGLPYGISNVIGYIPVSYTHLTLPTIYSV